MEANHYAPPSAPVAEVAAASAVGRPFFVVAPWKFALLFGATVGLYQYYWWYMQWARFRRQTGTPLWPVARAVFSIFFAHSLNDEIDHRLRTVGPHRWAPRALATGYVVAAIAATLSDRLAANDVALPYTSLAGLALLLPMGYCLARTQRAANAAAGDPGATANRSLTWANWIWIVLGAAFWIVVLLGIVVILAEAAGIA